MRNLVLLLPVLLGACRKPGPASESHARPTAAALDCDRDAAAAITDSEREAVAATVQLYFEGHATGNGDYHRRAFHPDARLFWVKGGELAQKTSAEFAAGASGKPADDEARRVRRIAAVDVSGDAAMAKSSFSIRTRGSSTTCRYSRSTGAGPSSTRSSIATRARQAPCDSLRFRS
jgi:hypothetical protein